MTELLRLRDPEVIEATQGFFDSATELLAASGVRTTREGHLDGCVTFRVNTGYGATQLSDKIQNHDPQHPKDTRCLRVAKLVVELSKPAYHCVEPGHHCSTGGSATVGYTCQASDTDRIVVAGLEETICIHPDPGGHRNGGLLSATHTREFDLSVRIKHMLPNEQQGTSNRVVRHTEGVTDIAILRRYQAAMLGLLEIVTRVPQPQVHGR